MACGSAAPAAPALGRPAPDFTLATLEDAPVQLSALRGQVVIVNFWASWCAPCINEMPRLAQWEQTHGADGLRVLGVDTLFQDSRQSVSDFVKQTGATYQILLDDSGTTAKQWGARQLPRSFVIDREGVVRYVRVGELTDDDMKQQVLPLLDAEPNS